MPSIERLPSLAVLRCFEASAKQESFTAAAEELGLTQGAVSRQVKDLEAQIGAVLFRRVGRGIRLTDAGRALFASLSDDLQSLRRTLQKAVAAGDNGQILAIAAPPTFAARWLVPRLEQFREMHDELELMVTSRPDPFDLYEEKVDVAIHFGGWDWPGAQLTPLCPENLVVVAAPKVLAHDPISVPADILKMPLLHLSARPDQWEQFGRSISVPSVPRQGNHFDQFSLVIEAAIGGMGAAILPTYLIENELDDGRLQALAKVDPDTDKSYFIATQMGQNTPLIAAFTAWLRKQTIKRRGL